MYLHLHSHFHIAEKELDVTVINFITITIIYHKYVNNKFHEKQEKTWFEKEEKTCIAKQCQQTEVLCSWHQATIAISRFQMSLATLAKVAKTSLSQNEIRW